MYSDANEHAVHTSMANSRHGKTCDYTVVVAGLADVSVERTQHIAAGIEALCAESEAPGGVPAKNRGDTANGP